MLALGLLSACAEKNQYKEAVLSQLKEDQDVKDYKIDPERMAACVVDTSSRNMPGFFPLDTERKKAYAAYAKMLTVTKSKNAEQVLTDLRAEFGSAQELSNAHSNYAESVLSCQTAMISEAEEKLEAEVSAEQNNSAAIKNDAESADHKSLTTQLPVQTQ